MLDIGNIHITINVNKYSCLFIVDMFIHLWVHVRELQFEFNLGKCMWAFRPDSCPKSSILSSFPGNEMYSVHQPLNGAQLS